MVKFYGPEKRLASIGSYTLETFSSYTPAVASVDLTAFKNFLNSQPNYIEVINSDATFSTILVYVAYVDNLYRFRISLNTGGTGTALQGSTDADYNTLVSTVLTNTGISLTPTFGSMTQTNNIVPTGMTYEYTSKQVTKFYGSVPTQVNVYSGEPRTAGTATFDASTFNANAAIKGIQGTISYLRFKDDADRTYLYAYLTDSTQITLFDTDLGIYGTFDEYGITQHVLDQVCYIDLTVTTETQDLSKEIVKYYASENGVTKLIYEASNV